MALAIPSTIINTLSGAIVGRQNLCDYIKNQLLTAGWTATFFKKGNDLFNANSVNPTAGDTVTLDGQVYTFAAAVGAANTVLIGASAYDSFYNLMSAVNGGPGAGTLYGAATVANATMTAGPLWRTPNLTLTVQTKSALEWAAPVLTVGETFTDVNTFFVRGANVDVGGWMVDSAAESTTTNKIRLYVLDCLETGAVDQIRLTLGNQEMTVRTNGLARVSDPFSFYWGFRLDATSANPWRINGHEYGFTMIWDGISAAACTSVNYFGCGVIRPDAAYVPATITAVNNNGGFVQIQINGDLGWTTGDQINIRGNTGWSVTDNINQQTTVTRDSATLYTTTLPFIGPYTANGTAACSSGLAATAQVNECAWGVCGNGGQTWLRKLLDSQPGGQYMSVLNGYALSSGTTGTGPGDPAIQTLGPATKSNNAPGLAYGGSALVSEPYYFGYNSALVDGRYLGTMYGMFVSLQSTTLDTAGTFYGNNWVCFTDANAGAATQQQGSVFLILP